MTLTTMKHTPGPWHVIADPAWVGKHPLHDARFVATCDFSKVEYTMEEGEDGGRPWRFEDSKDSIICTMPDAENQKANAKLIAAAPELLAACQAAMAALSEVPCLSNKQEAAKIACRSIVAKATK